MPKSAFQGQSSSPTQNKDSKAIQLKLNELLAANKYTSNRMVDIEDLTEEERETLHKFHERLSDFAQKDIDMHKSHSIDAADLLHQEKSNIRKGKPGH